MEKRVQALQKQRDLERKHKSEAENDKIECQRVVEDLIADNENTRKRLRQCQHDLGQLQAKHKELLGKHGVIANGNGNSGNNGNKAFNTKFVEAEAFHQMNFKDERANLATNINEQGKQCETSSEMKCNSYEKQLQKAINDLNVAGKELANVGSCRQADIDRLTREKETLKRHLRTKESHLQRLESFNDELECKLNEKNKQIKRLKNAQNQSAYENQNIVDKVELERKHHEKCQQVKVLQENRSEFTALASSQKQSASNVELNEEIERLKLQLSNVEEENSVREEDICSIKFLNDELTKRIQMMENKKNVSARKSAESHRAGIEELKTKIDSNESELFDLRKQNGHLVDEKNQQLAGHEREMKDVRDEMNNYKAQVQSNANVDNELRAALEKECQDLNQKFDDVLAANFAIETRCNKLEVLLDEKEGQITKLKSALADCNLKEEKLQMTVAASNVDGLQMGLSDSKNEVEKLTVSMSKLEAELSLKGNALREAEEQMTMLAQQHESLQDELEKKNEALREEKEQMKSTKMHAEKLQEDFKALQICCNKLKSDLNARKKEEKCSRAKQNDLFNKFRNATKERDALEKENDQLRKGIETQKAKEDSSSVTEEKCCDEILQLQANLTEMKERERKLQSHNYELKKRLDAQEAQCNSLTESINQLEKQVANYKNEAITSESKADELMQAVEEWQRKFDNLSSTLLDTEANMKIISENSSTTVRGLERENKQLKDDIDNAQFSIQEKQSEILLLEKKSHNYQELSLVLQKRSEEIVAKNRSIEETQSHNSKLVAEVRKLEGVIQQLQDKVQMLEGCKSNDLMLQEETFSKALPHDKGMKETFAPTNQGLTKNCNDVEAFQDEKKSVLNKNEHLHNCVGSSGRRNEANSM